MENKLEHPEISEKTFLALIFNAEGEGFTSSYLKNGCQDLRRDALYTWLILGIRENLKGQIDFLQIMVSAVEQLKIDKLI